MKCNKNIEEKEKITYEQLIAGAILKFEKIDNVDFSLLVRDFEEKTNSKIRSVWYNVENIVKYVRCKKMECIKKSFNY